MPARSGSVVVAQPSCVCGGLLEQVRLLRRLRNQSDAQAVVKGGCGRRRRRRADEVRRNDREMGGEVAASGDWEESRWSWYQRVVRDCGMEED